MVKNLPANAEDAGSIPGSGRSPREGNGNLLQYSYLGNPMDGGAGLATVREVPKTEADTISNSSLLSPKLTPSLVFPI